MPILCFLLDIGHGQIHHDEVGHYPRKTQQQEDHRVENGGEPVKAIAVCRGILDPLETGDIPGLGLQLLQAHAARADQEAVGPGFRLEDALIARRGKEQEIPEMIFEYAGNRDLTSRKRSVVSRQAVSGTQFPVCAYAARDQSTLLRCLHGRFGFGIRQLIKAIKLLGLRHDGRRGAERAACLKNKAAFADEGVRQIVVREDL